MKFKQIFLIVPAFALLISSCNEGGSAGKIETQADSVSYLIGAVDGERLVEDFERSSLDSLLDLKVLFKGFVSAANEEELDLNPDSNMQFLGEFNSAFREHMIACQAVTTGAMPKFEKSEDYMDSVAYLIGASYGKSILLGFSENGLDTIIDIKLYIKGMKDAALEDATILDTEENKDMVNKFFQAIQEERLLAEFGDNKIASEEYLAKNGALSNVTTTASGLQYEIINEGNGPKPTISDRVKVHYHGMLVDGTVFDSSVERGEPAVFGVGQVIPGWIEALQLMPVGSKWKVTIPSELAYGKNQQPGSPIKPFSTLVFEVELLEIVATPQDAGLNN